MYELHFKAKECHCQGLHLHREKEWVDVRFILTMKNKYMKENGCANILSICLGMKILIFT